MLQHVWMDHAGAAGPPRRHYVNVAVHEVPAPVVDPSIVARASRRAGENDSIDAFASHCVRTMPARTSFSSSLEILHPVERAVAHRIEERLAFRLARLLRHQALGDEETEGRGQTAADGVLPAGVKCTDDAFDRLRLLAADGRFDVCLAQQGRRCR